MGFRNKTISNYFKDRIEYLRSKRFPDEDIPVIIERAPTILNLNVKDLDANLGYLQKDFKLKGNIIDFNCTDAQSVIFSGLTHKINDHLLRGTRNTYYTQCILVQSHLFRSTVIYGYFLAKNEWLFKGDSTVYLWITKRKVC